MFEDLLRGWGGEEAAVRFDASTDTWIIHLASLELFGEDEARRDERVRAVADTLAECFCLAEAEGISTGAAAERMVAERLAAGPPA